jgi:hypothetical protein
VILAPVPTLAEIVADRATLLGLPFGALWALSLEAGRLQAEITMAMSAAQSTSGVDTIREDKSLTIEQAAERLQIAPTTMKRWLRKAPYNSAVVVRSRTCVRVSSQRLEDILLSGGARLRRKAVSV